MGRLDGYLRLSSPPSTATTPHQPLTQDQLTCKPLDLSPTDWYGWRGQVNLAVRYVAELDASETPNLKSRRDACAAKIKAVERISAVA